VRLQFSHVLTLSEAGMVPKIAIHRGAYVAGPFAQAPVALDGLARHITA